MASMDNLERQHEEIKELFKDMKKTLQSPLGDSQIDEMVKLVNTLAGKLKIHMSTEDRLLYPALKKSQNDKLRQAEKQYSSEMLSLSETFAAYKNKYNTRSKILADVKAFTSESQIMLRLLEGRIAKEDKELYPEMKKEWMI